MELWQYIWYSIIFIVCSTGAVLIIIFRIRLRQEKREEAQRKAQTKASRSDIFSILSDDFRHIQKANTDTYQNRQNLDLLSTIIQKLEAGEVVDTEVLIFLLSRMNGTEEAIEKIKEFSATR